VNTHASGFACKVSSSAFGKTFRSCSALTSGSPALAGACHVSNWRMPAILLP
jgi:hypothetical protein